MPSVEIENTTCPGVRTLNFRFAVREVYIQFTSAMFSMTAMK